MGRSLESYGRKSLDADVEKDGAQEINWDDTVTALYTEEELAEIRAEEERKKLQKMISELEEPETYDYDAQTLGEATKDVPTQDKLEADEYDEKMATLLAKEVEELEGIF